MKPSVLEKLRSGKPCVGTWLSLGSPIVAELAAQCGFDWLLVDLEHGCQTEASVLPMLQAVGARPVAVIVRVPSHEPSLIGRVLDWGADGIMAPHVDTAEQAAGLVRAMRYGPVGTRGFSRTVRAYDYGLTPPSSTQPAASAQPLLLAQIESTEALRNVTEIAAVEGVDSLFVGPADLKLSLSCDASAPSYEQALDRVLAAARSRPQLSTGILLRDASELSAHVARGFVHVAVDSDLAIVRAGLLKAATRP